MAAAVIGKKIVTRPVEKQEKRLVLILGCAGLLPFIGAALWAALISINYAPLLVFCYYSAGILCFLAGTVWHYQDRSRWLLLQSNLIVLLAVASLISFHFEQLYCIFLLLAGHCWMLYLDWYKNDYARWYKKYRLMLSTVVVVLHGSLIYIISQGSDY